MYGKIETVTGSVDNKEKYAADLDQALTVAGIGWYNLRYSLVLALFLVAAIVEPVGYSYVLPAAKCDLDMTDAQRGFIASVPYIGIVITSYPWGYLVDTQGRKKIAVYSSIATGLFGILSAFMPELISFTICKFISALCIAGPASVPYTFIGEIVPQRHRDLTLSIVNALQITGSALVPLFAWAILPLDFRIDFGMYEFRPWRLLTIINACIFLIAAFLMSFGPESPKFLVTQGKNDEALKMLQIMYAGNKRKTVDDYPVKALNLGPYINHEKRGLLTSLKVQSLPLLKPPFFKWLMLNSVLLFGVFATLNGLYVWVPDILNRVISGEGDGMTACEVIALRLNETIIEGECDDTIAQSTYMINLIANTSCALIAVLGSSTVKIIGKKALLMIIFCLIGVFCSLINVMTNDIVFATFLSSFPIMGMAIGPINAFSVGIFPTQLRGMAVSLTMMIGRIGSVIGANIAGVLLSAACEVTFYLFGGSLIFCGLLVVLLPGSGKAQPAAKSPKAMVTRI